METIRNIKAHKGRVLGSILATLAFLPLLLFLFLLRPAGGQIADAQPASHQTTYTVTDLGTLGGTFSLTPACSTVKLL